MAFTEIDRPDLYFNTVLYTGNGSTGHAITGVGFQPDWLWIKERSSTSSHFIYDVIRGVNVKLSSNTTDADSTVADSMTSFDSDGFTVGNNGATNENGQTVVAWNWLASNTTASNTDGDETSTISVNTTSGFSIVSWTSSDTTGATIGHGLGVAPKVVIFKNRSGIHDWVVYHSSIGATKALYLSGSSGSVTSTGFFQDTAPTNTTFRVGSNNNTRGALNDNMIAYCFAEVKGFSKFGSYIGNGSADGTFIYTGFKPAFAIFKNIDAAEAWNLFDNKRIGHNGSSTSGNFHLNPNSTAVENVNTGDYIDFLSNGIKIRTATNSMNVAQNYIYMAFAEEPLVGDNPATAR